jgi:hypothetical protein
LGWSWGGGQTAVPVRPPNPTAAPAPRPAKPPPATYESPTLISKNLDAKPQSCKEKKKTFAPFNTLRPLRQTPVKEKAAPNWSGLLISAVTPSGFEPLT